MIKRKEKLFCFCYRLSKTLQESSVQCLKLPNFSRIIGFVKICVPNYIMSQSIWVVLCFLQCLVLCSKSHSVSDIVTNRAICRLCLGQLEMKTNKGLIYFFVPTLRVAEVGRLLANAKNALNSFVGRVFANSRQKTLFFRVLPKLQQKGSFYLVLPSFT